MVYVGYVWCMLHSFVEYALAGYPASLGRKGGREGGREGGRGGAEGREEEVGRD